MKSKIDRKNKLRIGKDRAVEFLDGMILLYEGDISTGRKITTVRYSEIKDLLDGAVKCL